MFFFAVGFFGYYYYYKYSDSLNFLVPEYYAVFNAMATNLGQNYVPLYFRTKKKRLSRKK